MSIPELTKTLTERAVHQPVYCLTVCLLPDNLRQQQFLTTTDKPSTSIYTNTVTEWVTEHANVTLNFYLLILSYILKKEDTLRDSSLNFIHLSTNLKLNQTSASAIYSTLICL